MKSNIVIPEFSPKIFTKFLILCLAGTTWAQNPLIMNQFTADPTARVFNGRLYVYPSHDIRCEETQGRPDWFCMEDYHVFSSDNLTDWEDHGEILSQEDVSWADSEAYSMWAPDAIERDGKYYFYFPTRRKGAAAGEGGFSIGVAIADKAEGPYVPQQEPIGGVTGIDPNVFIDKDGQAYLYWSEGKIYGAKLKDNMLELASEPKVFTELPQEGHIEGPFVFEREGTYYMTYPHVANKTERLEYAIGGNPLGPFEYQGVIMDESPTGVWTNHQSIVEFKDQWYLFYHHNDLSPDFDKNRSIQADSLFFEENGKIEKVVPSLRGVGVTEGTGKIQLDRYSEKSNGASIAFNDPDNTFEGWYVSLNDGDWVQYNQVNLSENLKNVIFKASSETGGTLQLRLNKPDGPLLSEVEIPEGSEWQQVQGKVKRPLEGINNLVLVMKNGSGKVDWVQFKS